MISILKRTFWQSLAEEEKIQLNKGYVALAKNKWPNSEVVDFFARTETIDNLGRIFEANCEKSIPQFFGMTISCINNVTDMCNCHDPVFTDIRDYDLCCENWAKTSAGFDRRHLFRLLANSLPKIEIFIFSRF